MKYASKTRITKGRDGWEANTTIPLDGDESRAIAVGERFLKVSTHKRDGGRLVTTASVATKTDIGYQFAMFQDYMKTVSQSKSRCTDKNVEVQHCGVLNDMDFILADVRAYYAAKEASHA